MSALINECRLGWRVCWRVCVRVCAGAHIRMHAHLFCFANCKACERLTIFRMLNNTRTGNSRPTFSHLHPAADDVHDVRYHHHCANIIDSNLEHKQTYVCCVRMSMRTCMCVCAPVHARFRGYLLFSAHISRFL